MTMNNQPALPVATFSIAAFDPETSCLGVAVASKFPAAGAVVPWVRADCCAVATQAFANTSFGPGAFELIASGNSPQETLDILLGSDPDPSSRQVGIVDRHGQAATFTGSECNFWARGKTGPAYAVQGNILSGPETIDAIADTFERSHEEFPEKLLEALLAGDRAGGDRRGRQSAAVYITRSGAGYGGFNDRWIDYRVDDDPDPIPRLQKLLSLHRLYFGHSSPEDRIPLSDGALEDLLAILVSAGILSNLPDQPDNRDVRQALRTFIGNENFEERVNLDENWIDQPVLEYLQQKYL